jgi:hypothetical protein
LDASTFTYPEEIDHFLNWPLGTAARLARRHKLPHYRLPDDSIRFHKDEVEALVRHVPSSVRFDSPRPDDVITPEGTGVANS